MTCAHKECLCQLTQEQLTATGLGIFGYCGNSDCHHQVGSHRSAVSLPPAAAHAEFTFPPTYSIEVDDIPAALRDDDGDGNSSNHASNIFGGDSSMTVITWFKQKLVMPAQWELDHPLDASGSNSFRDYLDSFAAKGFQVWDINTREEATARLSVFVRDGRSILFSGRGDYLVTSNTESRASYLNGVLAVIEIQSKRNEAQCELQMLVYLLIMMNTRAMRNLVGFLVRDDGQCRAFRATRGSSGNCVYEQNDLFHVSHMADIFERLVNEQREPH